MENLTINMPVFDSENGDNSFSSQNWTGITVILDFFFFSFCVSSKSRFLTICTVKKLDCDNTFT